jgi:2-polyprenyl-3-methyl-5-hydroxy-6-metoxy-1,4-benzoquinol methylase
MNAVKQFYDQLQFPGTYTLAGLDYHSPKIRNPYLKVIDQQLTKPCSVLDIGCGTGLITNLFARRYPDIQFTGVDFSNSIDYAIEFSHKHLIKNATFVKQDFLQYKDTVQYDIIICQGVLHHIPNYQLAIDRMVSLLKPNGCLILSVYHPWGKLAKKIFNIDYKNYILHQDQENHPHETTFTLPQIQKLFPKFKLSNAYPSSINTYINVYALVNYRNGGLTTYVLENSQ